MLEQFRNTVGPSYPQVLHLRIQPTLDWKYFLKQNSRKYQKAKLEFAKLANYLHSIYIVLGIISNLEMN